MRDGNVDDDLGWYFSLTDLVCSPTCENRADFDGDTGETNLDKCLENGCRLGFYFDYTTESCVSDCSEAG